MPLNENYIMKKQLLLINLGLTVVTSSFASLPFTSNFFIDKLNQSKASVQKIMKSHDGYADFSGHWVGTCDNEPEEELTMVIKQSSDSSSIEIDNKKILIDAISTEAVNQNFETEGNIAHYRWNEDGQSILGTLLQYSKTGNMSQGDMKSYVGKFSLSKDNEKLVINFTFSVFTDGILNNNITSRCVYNKS